MRVHILAANDFLSHFFFFPVTVCMKMLVQQGIDIRFFTHLKRRTADCDVLLLDSKYFRSMWSDTSADVFGMLERLRQGCNGVIWLDTTDSTGAIQLQVLPYVDKYLKKQLLKDKTIYTRKLHGARLYTDYYHRKYHFKDEGAFEAQPADPAELPKLAVSWNLGLGPFAYNFRYEYVRSKLPYWMKKIAIFDYPHIQFFSPNSTRFLDISFRGSLKYNNNALSFQRLKSSEFLSKRSVDTRTVSRKVYLAELRNARLGMSPFGNGEICFRDFEIWIAGCTLIKPDMSHLDTWPDYYRRNDTYVSFLWDFSDIDEVVDSILQNDSKRLEIGQNGQNIYQNSISRGGMEKFVMRFENLVKCL